MDLDAFLKPLHIDPNALSSLAIDLSETYRHLALTSKDQFLATAINVLPNGSETGRFLAIDVGGSNLRVGFVELLGKNIHDVSSLRRSYDESWPIHDRFKNEKAEDLFTWIGECIAKVIGHCLNDLSGHNADKKPLDSVLPVGVAWSFPMIQNSLSEATLLTMGKGFAITSDMNLGDLLLAGYGHYLKHNAKANFIFPEIEIFAITNDAAATFASLAYTAGTIAGKRVSMGLIVGTGTNAAVMMNMKDLHSSKKDSLRLPSEVDSDHQSLVVNTEWTIKGAAGPLRKHGLISKWDIELDKQCEVPGFQPFEYMAGGRYLGELVRLAARDLFLQTQDVNELDLPQGLQTRNGLNTTLLSSTVAPATAMKSLAALLENELPALKGSPWYWSPENAQALWIIARYVQERSAKLVSAAVIGALTCTGDLHLGGGLGLDGSSISRALNESTEELIVAYTGGVISQYPGYLESCQDAIGRLLSDLAPDQSKQHVTLKEVQNGGVIGAGVLAGTVWNLPSAH